MESRFQINDVGNYNHVFAFFAWKADSMRKTFKYNLSTSSKNVKIMKKKLDKETNRCILESVSNVEAVFEARMNQKRSLARFPGRFH